MEEKCCDRVASGDEPKSKRNETREKQERSSFLDNSNKTEEDALALKKADEAYEEIVKKLQEYEKHSIVSFKNCSPYQLDPQMAEFWRNGQLCDIEIVSADGRSFSAHKLVLATKSDFMRTLLFEDRFKDDTKSLVQLPAGVSSRAAEHLLEWMYSSECNIEGLSEMVDLLEAASRLQFHVLVAQLEAAMIGKVDGDSCLDMWDLAERVNLEDLRDKARDVALENFPSIAKSKEFKELTLARLVELIKEDGLAAAKEEEIFTSAMDWVKAQKENPLSAEEIEMLLSCVRFPLMDENFVTEFVLEESVLIDNPICFRAVARYRTASARKGRQM